MRQLGDHLKLVWNRKTRKGFFLRAEDFFGYIKRVAQMRQASEAQRMAQARVARDFANDLLAADAAAWLVAAGDFNDCPRRAVRDGRDSPLFILAGGESETPLTNLLMTQGNRHAYTFFREGETAVLDHLLVSPALARRATAVRVPHINTPFPPQFTQDPITPFRSSDHDPLIAWFLGSD